MTQKNNPMNETILAAAQQYSDLCALTDRLQTTDVYPFKTWEAAWKKRQEATTQLLEVARTLPPRELT